MPIKLFDNQEYYLTNEIIKLFEDTLLQENLYEARLFFDKNIKEKKLEIFEDIYTKAECFSVLTKEDFNPVNSYFQENLTNGFIIEYFSRDYTGIIKSAFNYYNFWWRSYGFDPIEEVTKDNIFYIKKFLNFSSQNFDHKFEIDNETFNWNAYVDHYKNSPYGYDLTENETQLVSNSRVKLKHQNPVELKDVLYCTTMVRLQQKEINKGFINSELVLNEKHNRERIRNNRLKGKFVTDYELNSRYTNRIQTKHSKVENIYYEFWSFVADLFETFYKDNYEEFDDVYYLGELEDVKEVYQEQGFYDFIENEN